jgi:hypothetical protein
MSKIYDIYLASLLEETIQEINTELVTKEVVEQYVPENVPRLLDLEIYANYYIKVSNEPANVAKMACAYIESLVGMSDEDIDKLLCKTRLSEHTNYTDSIITPLTNYPDRYLVIYRYGGREIACCLVRYINPNQSE